MQQIFRRLYRLAGGRALLFASLFMTVTGIGVVTELAAQDPGKKKEEEVEEARKPTRKVIVPEDEDPGAKAPPKGASSAVDLRVAAKEVKHPDVKKLYQQLMIPHDTVFFSIETPHVEPIPGYYPEQPPRFTGSLKVQPFDTEWNRAKPIEAAARQIQRILYYEQKAIDLVDDFFRERFNEKAMGSGRYLAPADMYAVSENVLAYAVSFHESARQREERKGDEWKELETKLRKKLLEVQLRHLDALAVANDWENAYRKAIRLKDAYPNPDAQFEIVKSLQKLVEAAEKAGQFDQVQLRVRVIGEEFPNSLRSGEINERLEKAASDLLKTAKELGEPEKLTKEQRDLALSKVALAKTRWPFLPGLQDYELRLRNAYPTLRVGMRTLPGKVHLSPATALTDPERWAVELIFEGLVKASYSAAGGLRYEPGLAAAMPQLIPLGRQFQLARNASWSNGQPVTAPDVSNTVRLLKDPNWPGRNLAWADLIDDVVIGGDPFRVNLTLKQGFLDPLSLMAFKILPQERTRGEAALAQADDLAFATNPLGSGPFVYHRHEPFQVGAGAGAMRERVVFLANAYYGNRSGRLGLPRIREIHFIKSTTPAADFTNNVIDFFLDLRPQEIKEIESAGKAVRISRPLPTRRVYFLAVNHRKPALQKAELRQAIAHAINREAILTEHFRTKPDQNAHHPLNGPFPAGSWACYKDAPMDPYNSGRAKTMIEAVAKAGPKPDRLSLKFAEGDPYLEQALKTLCKQVQAEIGLELVLEKPLAPDKLRRDVEMNHDYDLAYYHYDFASDVYWLWPLFNPESTAPGGTNYLGYHLPADLQVQFRRAMNHRHFPQIQESKQLLHRSLYQQMPLIPLWQLDRFVAYHPNLKFDPDHRFDADRNPVPIDPLLVFTEADLWQLELTAASGRN